MSRLEDLMNSNGGGWIDLPFVTPREKPFVEQLDECVDRVSESMHRLADLLDGRQARARLATIFRGLGMHKRQYLNEKV